MKKEWTLFGAVLVLLILTTFFALGLCPSVIANDEDIVGKEEKNTLDEQFLLENYYLLFSPEKLSSRQYAKHVTGKKIQPLLSATTLILEVKHNWNELSPETQAKLRWVFSRPTEPDGGWDNSQHLLPQLYTSPSGRFVIHWTNGTDGGLPADAPPLVDTDNDGTPDYIEELADIFDNVWSFEINTYGYHEPPSDAAKPNDANNTNPNDKYDVFVYDLNGYAAGYADPEQYNSITHRHGESYSYIAIDNDHDLNWKETVAAHEFFHAIQFYYDCGEERWWMETTAVWMQDEVYDHDFYLHYLHHGPPPAMDPNGGWLDNPDVSLTTFNGWHEYGNVIFAKFLSEKMGRGIIKDIWEEMVSTDGIAAIDNVLKNKYGTDFKTIFNNFTVANYLNGINNHDGDFTNDQYEEGDLYDDVSLTSWKIYSGGKIEIPDTVNRWAADYIKITPDADTLHFKLDKNYYITSIRIAENNEIEVKRLSAAELKKYQLNETQMKEILNSQEYRKMLEDAGNVTNLTEQEVARAISTKEMEAITPNNTVTNADKYKEIVLIISPLEKQGGSYNLKLNEVQKIQNSIQPNQSAIYVIPVNVFFNPKPWNFYFWHGDVFTSVWWESPRNIKVNLTPFGFTSTVTDVPSAIDSKIEKVGENKWYWLNKVWKLEIKEKGTGTLSNPGFSLTSNYYEQMHQLPTVLKIKPIDMNAGSNTTPAPISFDVFVLDGSNLFWYSPFDPPTSANFEVKIGGKPVQSITVSEESQSLYHLTVVPPPQDSPGRYNLTVNFTFSKFGVSNTASIIEDGAVEYALGGNADIAIVIDSSGSMGWNDPQDTRKAAAKLFVDLARDEDQIAIIDFDESVKIWKELTLVRNNRSAIKSAIDKVDSYGWTNIGGGLEAGYNQLNGPNANPVHRKVAVLLTDGFHNTGTDPKDVVPLYVAKGWPIYTIALTGDADEDLLKYIASTTGGKYYRAPTAKELQQIYNEISQVVKKQAVIQKKEGTITQGESTTGSITVDNTIKSMDIGLTWAGSDLNLTLFYPDGRQVQLNASSPTGTDDPNITYLSAPTYEIYSVINPTPGNWTYKIIAVQTVGRENYTITAAATTPTMFSASCDKTSYFLGEPVEITAAFLNETGGIEGARVTVNITLPSLAIDTISMEDKGNGTYKAVYTNTTAPGTYKIEIEAVKGMIMRRQSLTFEVTTSQIGIAIAPTKVNLSSYPGAKVSFDVNITNLPGGSLLLISEFKSLFQEMAPKEMKMGQSPTQTTGIIVQPNPLVSEKGYVIDATNIIPQPTIVTIPDGQNGTVNITINIPRYAPAGNYTSSIRFVSPDGNLLMPLNLTVEKPTKDVFLLYIKESYDKWRKAVTPIEREYYIQKMADDLVMFYYAGR